MKTVLRIGTIPGWRGSTRRASVYVKIETDGIGGGQYVSFTGVVGPLSSGNCLGGCGQIDMEFAHRNPADNDERYGDPTPATAFNFAPGWSSELWLDLLDAWKRLHLERGQEAIAGAESFAATLPGADKAPAWV